MSHFRRTEKTISPMAGLLANVKNAFATEQVVSESIGKNVLSMENLSDNDFDELDNSYSVLSIISDNLMTPSSNGVMDYTRAQKEAGMYGAMIAGDPTRGLNQKTRVYSQEEYTYVANMPVVDGIEKRRGALEAYDMTENRDVIPNTYLYNVLAVKQNLFSEAFFTTYVLSPDKIGYSMEVKILYKYEDFERNISGELVDYKRKNFATVR